MKVVRLSLVATLLVCTSLWAEEIAPEDELFLAPSEGGARRLQAAEGVELTLYTEPSLGSAVVAEFASGTVLVNQGCQPTESGLWCRLRPLEGSSEGYAESQALSPVIGPDGTIATGPDDSRRRASRKRFDAVSEAPCAQEVGQDLGTCQIGVARSGGGDATVSATFPNGFSRLLYFVHGDFTRGNSTMSGVGTDTEWRVENGVHLIRVDDQRFEIPVSFVLGA